MQFHRLLKYFQIPRNIQKAPKKSNAMWLAKKVQSWVIHYSAVWMVPYWLSKSNLIFFFIGDGEIKKKLKFLKKFYKTFFSSLDNKKADCIDGIWFINFFLSLKICKGLFHIVEMCYDETLSVNCVFGDEPRNKLNWNNRCIFTTLSWEN